MNAIFQRESCVGSFENREQHVRFNGLRDEVVGTALHELQRQRELGRSRGDDHFGVGLLREDLLEDLRALFRPLRRRQHEIEDHQPRLVLHRFFSVTGFERDVTSSRQQLRPHTPERRIVVDDEHVLFQDFTPGTNEMVKVDGRVKVSVPP